MNANEKTNCEHESGQNQTPQHDCQTAATRAMSDAVHLHKHEQEGQPLVASQKPNHHSTSSKHTRFKMGSATYNRAVCQARANLLPRYFYLYRPVNVCLQTQDGLFKSSRRRQTRPAPGKLWLEMK